MNRLTASSFDQHESDDSDQAQAKEGKPRQRSAFAQRDNAGDRHAKRADADPYRVGGADQTMPWLPCSTVVDQSPSSVEPTVHVEARAGDVGRPSAREKRDQRRDFLGLPVAAEGGSLPLHLSELAICRIHVGVYRSRLNAVDGDSARAQVARPAARETRDRGLAGAIQSRARRNGAVRYDAADIDDATAVFHALRGLTRGEKHRAHVQIERPIEILFSRLFQRLESKHPGVVHENVQAAQGFDRLLEQAFDLRCIAHVRAHG